MTPECLIRQLHDQGIDPRDFALAMLDQLVWLDADDHTADQLAQRYRMTPAQALKAVMRREPQASHDATAERLNPYGFDMTAKVIGLGFVSPLRSGEQSP